MGSDKIRAAEHNLRLKGLAADALRAALTVPLDRARIAPAIGRVASIAGPGERFAALLVQLDRVSARPAA